MTIHRATNKDIVLQCDDCGEGLDGESPYWDKVWETAKDLGWNCEKRWVEKSNNYSWFHYCPDCAVPF